MGEDPSPTTYPDEKANHATRSIAIGVLDKSIRLIWFIAEG